MENFVFNVSLSNKKHKWNITMLKANQIFRVGFSNFASQKYFQMDPKVEVLIEMIEIQKANCYENKLAFEQQMLAMYNNSMVDGDITIIVRGMAKENDSQDICLCSPPLKKRRQSKIINNKDKNENENKNEDEYEIEDDISSEIKMSGLMLKSASPVFSAMLDTNHSMVEQRTKTIIIYSDFVEDVRDMFYYICTNELKLSANAARIHELAHFYLLHSLENICCARMLDELSADTFVSVMKIFDKYEISEGYERLLEFRKENWNDMKDRKDLPFNFRMWCHSTCSDSDNSNTST